MLSFDWLVSHQMRSEAITYVLMHFLILMYQIWPPAADSKLEQDKMYNERLNRTGKMMLRHVLPKDRTTSAGGSHKGPRG